MYGNIHELNVMNEFSSMHRIKRMEANICASVRPPTFFLYDYINMFYLIKHEKSIDGIHVLMCVLQTTHYF